MLFKYSYRLLTAVALAFNAFLVADINAQTPQLVFETEHAVDSIPIKAAAEKADTGRMMPGYNDMSGYNRPSYCLAGVRRHTSLIWRKGERDTLPPSDRKDPIPPEAVETGKKCIANVDLESVSLAELYSLVHLASLVGDMEKAESALERWLTLLPEDPRERGYALLDALSAMLSAYHPDSTLFVGERWVQRIDALGHGAYEPYLAALDRLKAHAVMKFDTAAMIRISRASHERAKNLSDEEIKLANVRLGEIFLDSLNILWYKSDQSELPETVKGTLANWVSENSEATWTVVMSELITYQASIQGSQLSHFPVYVHFPDSTQNIYKPGRVTLLIRSQLGDGQMTSNLAMLRRLYEKYSDQGLDIVLLLNTKGFAWASRPLSTSEEAKVIGWYFREHLGLPFRVAVMETQFGKMNDGRKVAEPIPYDNLYRPVSMLNVMIGKDGNISSIGIGFQSEAMLEAFIVRELGR